MPAGSPIILQPDSAYNEKIYVLMAKMCFYTICFEPYIYLTKQIYLSK
jgi:hypothetical protein